jgi:hypothetical protein
MMTAQNVFQALMICICLCCFTATAGETEDSAWDAGDWRHPDLKDVSIRTPPLVSKKYQAEIPDTLELTDHASLGINAITRMLNPKYAYAQYSYADLRHNPPFLTMEAGLTNLNPKWLEALPLLRMISGSTLNSDIDHHMIEGILHNTGFDGLTYQPPDHPGAFYEDFSRNQNKPATNIFGEGRQLLTWSIWTQIDPDNPVYRRVAEQKIQRLLELTAQKGDGLYFRRTQGYTPGQKDTDKLEIVAVTDHDVKKAEFGMVGTAVAHSVSVVAMGAARYYRVTGYPPALELARGLANYFRNDAGLIDETGRWHGYHFHIMALGILGQLEYALAAGDEDMLQYVRRAYEYARSIGDTTMGFFGGVPACDPCTFNPNAEECGKDKDRVLVEPCSVADMALIALQLTRAGVGDYYEDVEHYVRNFMLIAQLKNTDYLKEYPNGKVPGNPSDKYKEMKEKEPGRVGEDDVAARTVGSFCCVNLPAPNSQMPTTQFCGCCLGNAGRVLYYTWDRIMEVKDDDLWIHLLMNRASEWADLDSFLPYEGKIVLNMKRAKNVRVRIPGWTNAVKVSCTVNGHVRPVRWMRGNYLQIDSVRAGDEVVVEFPIVEKLLHRNLKGKDYWMSVRGFTVIDLEPHNRVTPIFQRTFYRNGKAPMRTVERVQSDKKIVW